MLCLTAGIGSSFHCLQLFDVIVTEFEGKHFISVNFLIVDHNVGVESLPGAIHFAADLRSADVLHQNVHSVVTQGVIVKVGVLDIQVEVICSLSNGLLLVVDQNDGPIRRTLCSVRK